MADLIVCLFVCLFVSAVGVFVCLFARRRRARPVPVACISALRTTHYASLSASSGSACRIALHRVAHRLVVELVVAERRLPPLQHLRAHGGPRVQPYRLPQSILRLTPSEYPEYRRARRSAAHALPPLAHRPRCRGHAHCGTRPCHRAVRRVSRAHSTRRRGARRASLCIGRALCLHAVEAFARFITTPTSPP